MNSVIPFVFQVFPEHGYAPAAPVFRQEKTEVIDEKLFKSYQVYKAVVKEQVQFFEIVIPYVLSLVDIEEIQNSAPILRDVWLQSSYVK